VVWLVSDMVEDCSRALRAPAVAAPRVFISPAEPVSSKTGMTSGEYFERVVTKMGRIAPWARVIPGSFDLSEMLDVLGGRAGLGHLQAGRPALPGGSR
jgi:hypothetical protein